MAKVHWSEQAKISNKLSYKSYGELMVSSAKYYCDTIESFDLADIIFLSHIPAYAAVVDIVLKWDRLSSSETNWALTVVSAVPKAANPFFDPISNYRWWWAIGADLTAEGISRLPKASSAAESQARFTPLPYDSYIGFWFPPGMWANRVAGYLYMDALFTPGQD